MRFPLLVPGAILLAGLGVAYAQQSATPENSDKAQTKDADYKISADDIARKNPVKTTPEGLAEARKAYGYDCAMCHGKDGDGKGDLAETMKLTLPDWRDAANPTTNKTDGELFYIITNGKGKMMAAGDRDPEKLRWNLVSLVRSFASKSGAEKPTTAAATSKP
jgi:mono/diheme cytochrome c family protein